MERNYYAVKKGKVPGIYSTWDECKKQTHRFPGAVFKRFDTLEEAENFIKNTGNSGSGNGHSQAGSPQDIPYAFSDGSFNEATGVYGCGGFVVDENGHHEFMNAGRHPDLVGMRNVAGELLGCITAVKLAVSLGHSHITIFYDYSGVEEWAEGRWSCNKEGTAAYRDRIAELKKDISITFRKVKGHSGVEGNEIADRLAKQAAGII